mgnify:CR=1 FL=1
MSSAASDTGSDAAPAFSAQHLHEVRRFFWRNYIAHVVEGGLFIGGMTFLSAESVMPAIIKTLGGPPWLISLTPMLMMLGFTAPQILTAHVVERLQWVKPFVMIVGIVQRLPYLIAALMLYFLADTHPTLVLIVVAATPLMSGLAGGTSVVAWVELISKVIPAHRRSSAWAIRYAITACIGIGAGSVIKDVLSEHPGAKGYALLHVITFAFLMLSFAVFSVIREVVPPRQRSRSRNLFENINDLLPLLRGDKTLRCFLSMRMLDTGIMIMLPFLGIHALSVTGREQSALGYFVTAQMSGSILGNLVAGYLGDRTGGKLPIVLARISILCASLAAMITHSYAGFMTVFFLTGAGMTMSAIGISTLSIEIAPHERRPTYQALISLAFLPAALIAASISTLVRMGLHMFAPAALLSALASLGSLYFLLRIKEPRQRQIHHTSSDAATVAANVNGTPIAMNSPKRTG